MPIVYAAASVLILKSIVCPWSTLMSLAKPWIVGSPAPETSHSDCGAPGFAFSQTIALAQGSPVARAGPASRGEQDRARENACGKQ